jgi:transposase-like protein
MKTEKINLRIDNPCPFVPLNRNKNANGYYCKSCNKTVVDFRNKTIEEIKCTVNKDTCGIFTINQLPGQQQMKLSKRVFFFCLTVLSVFGFSVKPIQAQTTTNNKDSVAVALNPTAIASNRVANTNEIPQQSIRSTKKKGIFRKKKKYRYISGCPAF